MNEFSRYYVRLFTAIWQHFVYFFRDILWNGIIVRLFKNIGQYWEILMQESLDFTVVSWIMVVIAGVINISLFAFIMIRLFLWLRKYVGFRSVEIEKQDLIDEIAMLNDRVVELADEKNQIMAMKVSQLGINATTRSEVGENYIPPAASSGSGQTIYLADGRTRYVSRGSNVTSDVQSSPQAPVAQKPKGPSRFVKLIDVDERYAGKDTHIFMEDEDYITLPEIVTRFVNFSASQLKLYYTPKMISLFFSGMAASKVVLLEGISGTGKTSLPYAMAKFFGNKAEIISVQPSWRDRAEIIGYLNEFTKRFNETDFLKALYESIYRKDVNFIVLDELNLARIEYYFAEFLSIMEMPNPSEWKIDLVPDSKPSDPLKVINGKITVPENVWFIGTANKDDSTFTITDKVYDRAMSLEFENKAEAFDAPEQDPIHMSHAYLQELFDEAHYKYPVSEEVLKKFDILDKYVQNKFKVAFGNRIMNQVHKFVPVYVACGGTEDDGMDYIFANKVLRKFESLNLAFLQDELKDLKEQIRKTFGKNSFEESLKFIDNLQKML